MFSTILYFNFHELKSVRYLIKEPFPICVMKVLHTFLINMRPPPPPLLSFCLALEFLDSEIMMAVRDFVVKVF